MEGQLPWLSLSSTLDETPAPGGEQGCAVGREEPALS